MPRCPICAAQARAERPHGGIGARSASIWSARWASTRIASARDAPRGRRHQGRL